jgi:hypothetical protein
MEACWWGKDVVLVSVVLLMRTSGLEQPVALVARKSDHLESVGSR